MVIRVLFALRWVNVVDFIVDIDVVVVVVVVDDDNVVVVVICPRDLPLKFRKSGH